MPTITTLSLLALIGINPAEAADRGEAIVQSDLDVAEVGLDAEPGVTFRSRPRSSSRPSSASRPSSSRSGSASRPSSASHRSHHSTHRTTHTSSRSHSTRTVVHTRSSRPVAIPASSRPPTTGVRVVHSRPTYRVVRPYHGVFVYGPRPVYHRHYHVTHHESSSAPVQKEHLPTRQLDRTDTLAIGLRTGSYYSAYDGANGYADLGLGLTARYRPAESVGLELAISSHAEDWDSSSERDHTVTQGSVMLFASPWSRISPYALAGVTHTGRSINDEILDRNTDQVTVISTGAPQYGLHGGLGVEFALGKNLAFDLEGRYVGYVNENSPDDPSVPGAFTTTAGFLVHF